MRDAGLSGTLRTSYAELIIARHATVARQEMAALAEQLQALVERGTNIAARGNRNVSAQRTAEAAGACPFGAVTCGSAGTENSVSGRGGAGGGGLSLSHDTVANAASISATTAKTERLMS